MYVYRYMYLLMNNLNSHFRKSSNVNLQEKIPFNIICMNFNFNKFHIHKCRLNNIHLKENIQICKSCMYILFNNQHNQKSNIINNCYLKENNLNNKNCMCINQNIFSNYLYNSHKNFIKKKNHLYKRNKYYLSIFYSPKQRKDMSYYLINSIHMECIRFHQANLFVNNLFSQYLINSNLDIEHLCI